MAKVSGADRHKQRLRKLMGAEASRRITAALYAGGQQIEIEAERSITEGSVSGKGHVPSRPGQPPNADTRLLDQSIETEIPANRGPYDGRVDVTSNAPYAAFLEFGTSKMDARPYMKPATRKKRRVVKDMVQAALSNIVRQS